jgi:histidine triad (HIT) family protein
MYNHAPNNYHCPICLGVQGIENEHTLLLKQDLVYQDDLVSAFINSFWVKNNPGHVIIVPNEHIENIYEMTEALGAHIFAVSKRVALAMKEVYHCDGITTMQNNEPAGDQHAFHYHLHIYPRYEGDELHQNMMNKKEVADQGKRAEFASKLRKNLSQSQ